MSAAPRYQAFVGVDIAAATCVAVWRDDRRPTSFAQTPDGWAAFLEALATAQLAPATTLVVMEATGSYVRRITARAIPPAGRMGSEGSPWVND
jgi:transposase